MNNAYIANSFRFLFLLLVQILILNELELHGFIRPFIYPLFIFLLPIRMPHALTLLIAFGYGLLLDVYDNTLGFHTAATVFIAYIRPYLFGLVRPRDGYDNIPSPVLPIIGFSWTILALTIFTVLHHLLLFFIEAGGIMTFGQTFVKVLINTLFSVSLMLLYQIVTKPSQ